MDHQQSFFLYNQLLLSSSGVNKLIPGPTAAWLCQKPHLSEHMTTQAVRLSLLRQLIWHVPQLKRKCANLQSDPGEGRSQEPAFGPFTNRIHHQSWIETHLEQERSLTKHRLHKINASRLLLVQVSLRGASDLNYQECFRKQQNSSCSLSQTHNGHQQHF